MLVTYVTHATRWNHNGNVLELDNTYMPTFYIVSTLFLFKGIETTLLLSDSFYDGSHFSLQSDDECNFVATNNTHSRRVPTKQT